MDFTKLKIKTTFEDDLFGTQKIITTVPVRKPKKMEFFRVREGEEWTFDTYMIAPDDSGDEEKYLVAPEFWPEFQQCGLLKAVRFFALISHSTRVFYLSEVALPDAEGKWNSYNRSRIEHYERAKTEWVNITANQGLGAYEVRLPMAKLPEPEWPEKPANMLEALEIAFKDKSIESEDHPVLNRLRGLV